MSRVQEKAPARLRTLLALPNELLNQILSELPQRELLNCSLINRRFNVLSIQLLYRRVNLGHFAAEESDLRQSPANKMSEILATQKLLSALGNPRLAKAIAFIDHVDEDRPKLRRITGGLTTTQDFTDRDSNQGQDVQVAHRIYPKSFVRDLESALTIAHSNLLSHGSSLRILRVIHGSPGLTRILLKLPWQCPTLTKFWLEEPQTAEDETLLQALPSGSGSEGSENGTTSLTHVRFRKLKDWQAMGYISSLLSSSPNLVSIALDTVQNLQRIPEMLESLTFPNLQAFQIRSQTDGELGIPVFLSEPRVLAFLLRHKKLQGLAWPLEHFIAAPKEAASLAPLLEQFSRTLTWLRTDCTLLDVLGPLRDEPRGSRVASRQFLTQLLGALNVLKTLKLQGTFHLSELHSYFSAIGRTGSRHTMRKLSLIRGQIDKDLLPEIPLNMPNLVELKNCAYNRPHLVGIGDGIRGLNIEQFCEHLAGCSSLEQVTVPLQMRVSDETVTKCWDAVRPVLSEKEGQAELGPSVELDVDNSGPVKAHAGNAGVEAPPFYDPVKIARTALEAFSKKGNFPKLKSIRMFFIFTVRRGRYQHMDCYEILIPVKATKVVEPEPESQSEPEKEQEEMRAVHGKVKEQLNGLLQEGWLDGSAVQREAEPKSKLKLVFDGKPVLSYGWGTGIWNGEIKALETRSWF